MKRILLSIICMAVLLAVQAQAPQAFSYKALIKNQYGLPVVNKSVAIQISIIQGTISGSAVYIEKHKVITSLLGTVDIEIGRGTSILGLFDAIDWSQSPYFVKSEVDIKGGTNYQLIAITELLSVPYALYAGNAANGFSGNYYDLQNKPIIPTNLSELSNDAGYISIETDPEFNKSLAKGITETDTSNWNSKSNFNGDYTALSHKPFIPTKTSELENNSGFIAIEADGDPTNELQTLRISHDTIYLSNGGFVKLPASIGFNGDYNNLSNKPDLTIYATRNMQGLSIKNLGDPFDDNDAATKSYVDNAFSNFFVLIDSMKNRLDSAIKELVASPLDPPVAFSGCYIDDLTIPTMKWFVTDPIKDRVLLYDLYVSVPDGTTTLYSNLLLPFKEISTEDLTPGFYSCFVVAKDLFNHIQVGCKVTKIVN